MTAPSFTAAACRSAAAPDLLEALLAIQNGPRIECIPDNDVQDMVRAAISRATGDA